MSNMEAKYEGRLKIEGFGTNFLPDAANEHGDMPSVDRWIQDQLGVGDRVGTVRVRLTVELVEDA